MAEGTIKRLTDKGFGFISTGKEKTCSFTPRSWSACVLRNCVRAKRCPSPKDRDQRGRRPRTCKWFDQTVEMAEWILIRRITSISADGPRRNPVYPRHLHDSGQGRD